MQFSSPPRSPSPRRSPNLSRSLADSAMPSSPNSPVRRNIPQFGTIPSLEPMTPIEPLNSPSLHSSESEDGFGEDETRLIIQNLVLINYKSYAGRQEVGPFNDSFTAVVGPNGSGKSNVIDSLLFVFGFRAKKMRQDKLSGLIHKSEAHPDLSFARVEVHFATKNVPNSELVVAREVKRDNSNFYTLNGKRSSYNDVAKLLESRGIDLKHKRFLILQGEVESIALMPPKAEGDGDDGLLEYLEDIIGTSNYKVAIKDLEDQGDGLRVDSGEKQRRLDIVAKDLRNLDSGRQQIERFMATSNSLNSNKSKLWQLQSYKLQTAANINQESLTEAQAKLESLQTQFADHNREISELNTEVEAKFNERKQLAQQSKSNSQELKKLQTTKTRFDQMTSQLETKRRKLERDLNHSKFTLRESQNWLANFAQDSQQWNSKLAELKTTAADEQTILDAIEADLHEKTKDLHTELDDLQAQAAPFRDQISEKSHLIKNLNTEITQIEAKLDVAINEESECLTAAEQLISEGKASKRKVNEFTNTVESLTNEQTTTKESLASLTQRKDDVLAQIAKLKPEIRNAKDAKTRTQIRNRIESELMRLKISGLYGRLGSLGQIDQKYDIAVSTAGPELNNFVVDTVDTAKKCVDELRKRNLGRAKFMVLDKLNPNYTKDGQSLPAPRLLDLVTPVDQSFFKAFASVLGDTLVVATSDEASKVAFGGPRRHKVVTLDGILVNSSGQMSGGGRPMRGLMSKSIHSVSNEELESMEKQLASLEYDSADQHSEIYRLNTRISELEQEIPKAKTNLEKEQLTLSNLESQMMSIREKRRDLKKNVEQCKAQLTDQTTKSNAAIAELQAEQDSLEQQSKTVENAIKAIQDRILEIGGAKLREQRSKMSNLQIQIESLNTQVNNGNALEAQHQSKIKKLESEIQQLEEQLNDNEQPDNQFSEADSQRLVQLENDAAALNGNIKSLDAQIATVKQQIADISSGIESAKTEEIALANEIDSLGNELKAKEAQIQELKRKHDSIQMYDLHTARDLMADQQAEQETREKEQDQAEAEEAEQQQLGEHSLHDIDESRMETDAPELDYDDEGMDSDSDAASDADMTASNAGIYELSPDELMELDERSLKDTIQRLDRQAKEYKVNFEILDLYNQKFAEYMERKAVSDEALALYNKNLDDLKKNKHRRLKEFMTGFNQISSKLKEMYRLITIGGNAELELIDSLDPFTEGISFSVMPPRKSWRNISNLSGGEKTLSSLALVFALHHYKPTPLYVMDEIDAALDYRNVSIIANYIKERTKNGQFIVISLRNNMFELATRLVGVYKINNMTRSVAMQIE